ncbi:MAG: HNH endonuclease [Chloroflexi bacterium]|nr:HNH endonuclease [Chloroflexota bacterium]
MSNRLYIPQNIRQQVRETAKHRCGYCLSPQSLTMARLEIEHIIPLAKGGSNEETNLWLACPICNRYKSDQIAALDPATGNDAPLFNPHAQRWSDHFQWSEDGLRIIGKTPTGRATVLALHLSDDPDVLTVRSYWVTAGWHPPKE